MGKLLPIPWGEDWLFYAVLMWEPYTLCLLTLFNLTVSIFHYPFKSFCESCYYFKTINPWAACTTHYVMLWSTSLPPLKHFPAFNFPERRYHLFHLSTCTLCDTHYRLNIFTSRLYKEGRCNLVIFFLLYFLVWTQESALIKTLETPVPQATLPSQRWLQSLLLRAA